MSQSFCKIIVNLLIMTGDVIATKPSFCFLTACTTYHKSKKMNMYA